MKPVETVTAVGTGYFDRVRRFRSQTRKYASSRYVFSGGEVVCQHPAPTCALLFPWNARQSSSSSHRGSPCKNRMIQICHP